MQKMDDTRRTVIAMQALKAAKPDLRLRLTTLHPSPNIIRYVPHQLPLL